MIIVSFIFFLVAFLFISASLAGQGKIIGFKEDLNLFENIFLGFIFLAIFNTFLHFFFKISIYSSLMIFSLGLIFFFKKLFVKKSIFSKKNIIFLLILLILVPIFISQKYHEDFGYYHLPYALLLIKEKIIFGIANSNAAYVYNSLWLNIYPSFFLWDSNFDYLTFSSFILYVIFIFFLINGILIEKDWKLSKLFAIISVFYFILKFTRISEYGVDIPSAIYSNIAILYFIKFFETKNENEKKKLFFLILNFSIFSLLIKLSSIPIIVLSIVLYFQNFKFLKTSILEIKFSWIYFLVTLFLIQQFIYTGCVGFPNSFSCFNVSWFNDYFLTLKNILETINKSYGEAKDIMSSQEYLENFRWFPFWLNRNYFEILNHILTMALPILIIYFILRNQNKKYYKLYKVRLNLTIYVFVSLIFWLSFSPVYRFAIPYFITFVFLIFSVFFDKKIISNKIFLSILIICLLFNFSKNMNRIFDKNKIYFGIDKIENKYVKDFENSKPYMGIFFVDTKNNNANGWQGRLCWDVPIICTNLKIQINKNKNYLFISKF